MCVSVETRLSAVHVSQVAVGELQWTLLTHTHAYSPDVLELVVQREVNNDDVVLQVFEFDSDNGII